MTSAVRRSRYLAGLEIKLTPAGEIRVRQGRLLLVIAFGLALAGCRSGNAPGPAATPVPTQARVVITFTPRPKESNLVTLSDRIVGPETAYLTIAMYGDFQSEVCAAVARTLLILRQRYPNDVRVIWRHFPQPDNDKARLAAQAAEAAAAQGKFWEMHKTLLDEQAQWRSLPQDQFFLKLSEYARRIGLADVSAFENALRSQTYAASIDQAYRQAVGLGLQGAPVLAFNGLRYSGRIDEFALDNYMRQRLLEKRWFKNQPALQIKLDHKYTATLATEYGVVVIELLPRAAPVAVNNFVFLARQGWYNDITFHLVTAELVQTGDPSGSGLGIAGYTIADEFNNGLIFDREGLVAMAHARGAENSASSQFFVTLGPLRPVEYFDGQYTIFGRVTQGMDVLRKLRKRDPFDEQNFPNPPPGDKLIRVEIGESE